jgi:fumarate hydratase subunit beta
LAEPIKIQTPLSDEVLSGLKAGDQVLLSGVIYTGRDAAHRRMMDALDTGNALPFPLDGSCISAIYYVGPTPPRPGKPIGSAGPTTSGRMDAYAPRLMKLGLKVMIGKGMRSQEVKNAIVETKSVYLAAIGGAGALMASCIKEAEVIAYEDLGTEAVHKLTVSDMPLVVINDSAGGDLYAEGRLRYQRGE